MIWALCITALVAGSIAWVSWRRLARWRRRMRAAMHDAQRLGLVACIECGEIDEPVVVSGEDDARVACKHCLAFGLEPVEGA